MWKILIVEDEVHLRTALRNSIDWEGIGFEIVGEAGNGSRALEFMERETPDLVICDILMPVMDGVELLRKAREAGYPSLFVMLTCMNEFEYARAALQYGAFDYILKLSMDVDTLRNVLRKADEELQRGARLASQQTYYDCRRTYEDMWETLIQGKEYEEATPLPKRDLPPGVLVCAVLHGAFGFTADDFAALELAKPDKHAVIHEFAGYGQTTFMYWSPHALHVRPVVRRTRDYALAACPAPAEGMFDAWRSALGMLDACWYGNIADMASVQPAAGTPACDRALSWKNERRLIQCVEQGQLEQFATLLAEVWEDMERRHCPMLIVKHTALQLDQLLVRIAQLPLDVPEELAAATTHRGLLDAMLARLRRGMDRRHRQIAAVTDHSEINKILDYINRHYDRTITLKSMAQYVAMDEHYVSSLFKKKTGGNFIDYLHDVRIEKAKHLLDHTDMTVNEVGRRVGFANDNYFIKIFKRRTGMTPTHYRNRTPS